MLSYVDRKSSLSGPLQISNYLVTYSELQERSYCLFKPRLHYTTYCQTGCQTTCQTGLTTGCIVYTAGCQTGLYNRFDNRVERTVCSFNTVVKSVVQRGLTTG